MEPQSVLPDPLKPKDKPNVEGTVNVLETWILAALRNRNFFSFDELNKAIRERLEEFNAKPFQKKRKPIDSIC